MEQQPTPPPPATPPTFVWVAVLMGVVILAVQALVLFVVFDTRSNVTGVEEGLRDVELRLAGAVPADANEPAAVPTSSTAPAPTAAPQTTSGAPATTLPPLALDELPRSPAPEFASEADGLPTLASNTGADPAAGAQLGTLGAAEWATGDELVVDLRDGKPRVVVVFAHWCEPCRELLAQLADWHETAGADLENVELVTVASAAEEEADETLPEYLSESAFPFPVLVDSSNEIAARLGVSAFPFWLFVSPDGQVIGRIAGQLPVEQFSALFADLDEISAEG